MFQKLYHRNFQNILYLSLLPRSHYQKVHTSNLHCHWLDEKVLDDGLLFFGIARCQERGSIVCKHRRIKKRKRKYTSLFIKYLQTAFLKAIHPLQWDSMPRQSEVIRK